MKVAILGAPGAGKTKIARRVSRRLNDESQHWTSIDSYVDKLRERTDLPFGAQSDYVHNYMVMVERWILEAEAFRKGMHTITCGTIYETIIYCTPRTLTTWASLSESQQISERVFGETVLAAIGALADRNFDYDCLFYLPWTGEHDDNGWEAVVNAKIPEVLEGFYKQAIVLRGTDREKVNSAIEVIQAIQATTAALTVDEQPAI